MPNVDPPAAASVTTETLTEIPPPIETPSAIQVVSVAAVDPPASPSPSTSEISSKSAKRTSTFRHVRPTRVNPRKDVESSSITPPTTATTTEIALPAASPPATTTATTPIPTTPTPRSPSPAPIQPALKPVPGVQKGPSAPYRPGFQPKGLYRPRTDEFLSHRQHALDAQHKRIERTKLDRRLDKLISLHFPSNRQPQPPMNRRASSIFDFELSDFDLRRSVSDALKGVLVSNVDEIRGNVLYIYPPSLPYIYSKPRNRG